MRAGQQYGMQPQQQQGKDNIAYNVEHVFKDENGREVRIIKNFFSQISVQFLNENVCSGAKNAGGNRRGDNMGGVCTRRSWRETG